MAEFTLAQLLSAIRFRGDYTNLRKFPEANLTVEAQKGFDKFYQIVAEAKQGWWDTVASVSTVAGQEYVALPSACWTVKNVAILDGSEPVPMRCIGIDATYRFGSSQGRPSAYRHTARGIELYDTPDAVYTLKVHYTPRAPTLDSTAHDYYNGWEDYVIEYVLWKLAEREKMPTAEHTNALARIEAEVRAGAAARNEQEPQYLPLRETLLDIDDERWR